MNFSLAVSVLLFRFGKITKCPQLGIWCSDIWENLRLNRLPSRQTCWLWPELSEDQCRAAAKHQRKQGGKIFGIPLNILYLQGETLSHIQRRAETRAALFFLKPSANWQQTSNKSKITNCAFLCLHNNPWNANQTQGPREITSNEWNVQASNCIPEGRLIFKWNI